MSWLTDKLRTQRTAAPEPILALWSDLGEEERAVLILIAQRLLMGQAQYGRFCHATARRDFPGEALEECADGLVYAAIALIGLRRS